jgi:RNA polymerase-binding transcription factor DksA
LLERRDALVARHQANAAAENELLEDREHDLPDVAAERSAAAVLERLDDADQMQLLRIARALTRIDEGTYGMCVVCGAMIAPARLAVVPEADRCAGCSNSH